MKLPHVAQVLAEGGSGTVRRQRHHPLNIRREEPDAGVSGLAEHIRLLPAAGADHPETRSVHTALPALLRSPISSGATAPTAQA